MKSKLSAAIISLMLMLTLTACEEESEPKILASVNGHNITQEQFDETCKFYRLQTEKMKDVIFSSDDYTESDLAQLSQTGIFELKSDKEYLDIMIENEYFASLEPSDATYKDMYNSAKDSYEVTAAADDDYSVKYNNAVNEIISEMGWTLDDYFDAIADLWLATYEKKELKIKYAEENDTSDVEQFDKEFEDYLNSEIEKATAVYLDTGGDN